MPRWLSQSIFLFSKIRGSFFLVSIGDFEVVGGRSRAVREVICTGLPVVSWAYMPAAEMPMPCWPRLMRSRWNFEP